MIQELVEFNQWQAYSYSREQLIEKLAGMGRTRSKDLFSN